MDNQRVFLWIALALVVWLNYTAYVQYQRSTIEPPAAVDSGAVPTLPEDVRIPEVPRPRRSPACLAATFPRRREPPTRRSWPRATRRRSRTGASAFPPTCSRWRLSLRGGDLVKALLPRYPVHKNQPDVPVQLLDPSPDNLFIFRTGLTSTAPETSTRPETDCSSPQPRNSAWNPARTCSRCR
jgi:YidC/Oxa1 family membrane protein insertase